MKTRFGPGDRTAFVFMVPVLPQGQPSSPLKDALTSIGVVPHPLYWRGPGMGCTPCCLADRCFSTGCKPPVEGDGQGVSYYSSYQWQDPPGPLPVSSPVTGYCTE